MATGNRPSKDMGIMKPTDVVPKSPPQDNQQKETNVIETVSVYGYTPSWSFILSALR